MYHFLEQKPVVVAGKIVNSKARSWTASLLDGRFPEQPEAVRNLMFALGTSMNAQKKGERIFKRLSS